MNSILEDTDDLAIPGRLLHMLDTLGTTIQLNGSHAATTVRNNIALVMADAEPNNPVRGIRIATRTDDAFVDDAFQLITGEFGVTRIVKQMKMWLREESCRRSSTKLIL